MFPVTVNNYGTQKCINDSAVANGFNTAVLIHVRY